MFAEPFRLDYERWAVEFAKLSLQETNLVAWSIDDFTHNLAKTYTPAYVKSMLDGAHQINPKLAFVPCCYFPTIKAAFATNYCSPTTFVGTADEQGVARGAGMSASSLITAVASSGYANGTGTVTVNPSGFIINPSQGSITTTTLSPPTNITLQPAILRPMTLAYA